MHAHSLQFASISLYMVAYSKPKNNLNVQTCLPNLGFVHQFFNIYSSLRYAQTIQGDKDVRLSRVHFINFCEFDVSNTAKDSKSPNNIV